jgi:ABC-2 type transport system permease protein
MSRAIAAEWIKLRSLRSTWNTLGCLFFVGLGITILSSNAAQHAYAEAGSAWDPTKHSLTTYIVAQLIVGVLGILVVTSEFATGLMRTTMTATPRRHRVLAAKVVTAAAVAVVAGQTMMVAAFLIGQSLLGRKGVPNAGLGDPGVLRAVFAGGLYLTLIALLAVGLGAIAKATAGALATLVGIVFLVPALAGLFPSWMRGVFDFWPTLGAAAALGTVPDPDFPHPWWNLAGLAAGVAGVLVAAFVVVRRRDV